MRIICNALLFLFLTVNAYAGGAMGLMMAGGSAAASVQTDSCTGGLLFSWHMENVDVTLGGVAGGVNNGCSAGDTTATANSTVAISNTQAWDGTYSLSAPTATDYYKFTVSADDIVKPGAGTVVTKFRLNTYAANAAIFRTFIDADNYISLVYTGTDELSLAYEGTNVVKTATTTDANIQVDTWYTVTAKWSVVGVDEGGTKYLSLQVCDTNNANCSTKILVTTALTAFTGSFGADSLRLGESTGVAAVSFVDNIKIYDSWQ